MARSSPATIDRAPPVSVIVPLTVLANVIVSRRRGVGVGDGDRVAQRAVDVAPPSGAPSAVESTV